MQKMWPGMWDLSACGHVDSGETSFQAIHRELLEELGLDVHPSEFKPIGIADSENKQGNSINRHRNHYFVYKVDDIDLQSLNLQRTEVSEVKWVDKEEIMARIGNNYDGITDKTTAWNCLLEYYKSLEQSKETDFTK